MSRAINALSRADLAAGLKAVDKDVLQLTRELSGADSEPVKTAANVLKANWRRELGVSGGGTPAPPGSPPHRQRGTVQKSILTAVVDGVRRVGSGFFVARLTNDGYEARDGSQVEPRPHGRIALEKSVDEMVDVAVSAMQKRVSRLP